MIKMFDRDNTGQIDLNEFNQLWNYLGQWRQVFDGYDADRSGHISRQEFATALQQMGYRLVHFNADVSVITLLFLDFLLNLSSHFTRSMIIIEMEQFNLMVLYIPLF